MVTQTTALQSAHSAAGAPGPKPFNFEGIRPAADHRRYAPAHVIAIYMSWSRDERSSGPRGYHHGNLKEALLRAALELIAQKGPAGFTFAEAARWAGVSPAAPYRHFRDRDELLASVALRGFEHFAIVLEQAWDDGRPQPFAALDRLGKAYLAFARTEPAYYSAMFEAGIPLATSPELREAGERAFAILRGASERLCAQMPPQSRPPAFDGRSAYLGHVTRHCLAVWPRRRGTAHIADVARRAP
jgi:AcrR family transcriptional regulator